MVWFNCVIETAGSLKMVNIFAILLLMAKPIKSLTLSYSLTVSPDLALFRLGFL